MSITDKVLGDMTADIQANFNSIIDSVTSATQFSSLSAFADINALIAEVKRLRDLYEPIAPASPQLKTAIPSYFYPGSLWATLDSKTSIAIINPASGPGAALDPNYASTVKAAQAKGITVLGYATSSYTQKATATFQSEVDKYYSWYGVDGIFIDECSTDPTKVNWYVTMNNYIKMKGGKALTVINPGTLIPEAYVNCADIIVNFEADALSYLNFKLSGWETKYPSSKFWHLIHTCSAITQLSDVMNKVKTMNAGYVYVTPDTLPNPWDTLPPASYWQAELGLR